MIVCLDVGYEGEKALAAAVAFQDWTDSTPAQSVTTRLSSVAEYVPGRFYERELPCLLAVLEKLSGEPSAILVDGHVTLDDSGRPGLGWHLYEALDQACPVIGVAKSVFAGLAKVARVCRGESERPLYITAAGMTQQEAAQCVMKMHGEYRIPTMLKLVDQLSRGAAKS